MTTDMRIEQKNSSPRIIIEPRHFPTFFLGILFLMIFAAAAKAHESGVALNPTTSAQTTAPGATDAPQPGNAATPPTLPATASPGSPPPRTNCKAIPGIYWAPNWHMPTFIRVRISADGMLHDPVVVKSSGDDDLDKAVLTCADGFKFVPAKLHGKPAEVTWVIGYFFDLSYFLPANPNGKPSAFCKAAEWYPYSAARSHHTGTAEISYLIDADGHMQNLTIMKSSGYDELDDAALKCASSWRFYPATQNGKPAELDKVESISWMTR